MSNRSLGSLTLDLKANTSQYTQGLSQTERATDDTVKATASQERQLARLNRSLDPTTAKLDQLGKQQAQVARLFESGAIDRSTYDRLTSAIDGKRAALTNLEKTQNSYLAGMRRVAGQAARTAAAVAAIGAAAAAAAIGGIAVMTRNSMNAIDEQAKLARSLNGTIDGIRSLQIAAGDAGVDGLEGSLARLNRRLGAVEMSGGPALATVERLGLSIERMRGIDADERIAYIADQIRATGMSSQEAARHLQQLGFTQQGVTELFMNGGDAIRDARQELEDYGLSVDMADAAIIEAANDQLSRVTRLLEGVRTTLAVELSPYILEIATRFNGAARASGGMGDWVSSAVETSVRAIAGLIDWVSRLWAGFQRGRLIIADMELLFAKFAQNSWAHISQFVDSWIHGINTIIRGLNRLGGSMAEVDLFSDSDWVRRFDDQVEQALGRRNLAAMRASDPTDLTGGLDQFLEDVRQRREALGETASNLPIFDETDIETGDEISKKTDKNKKSTDDFARSLQSLEDQLFPVEAAQRRYADQQAILNRAFAEGRIEIDRYDEAMERLEQAQRNRQGPESVYGSLFNPSDSDDGEESELQKFMAEAEQTFENFESMSSSVAANFGSSFTTQFSRILTQAETLGDVFRGVGDAIVQSVIGAVAQLAAEWLAFKTMEMLLGRQSEAAAVAGAATAGSAIAAAYSPAAAMASLASFGSNAASAMAGITATTGLASSLALTGMAHDGLDSVPQTGTWLLEKGERVTTAETSAKLDRTLSNIEKNGNGSGQVIVNNYSNARVNQSRDSRGNVILELIDDLQTDGQFSQALGAYTTATRRPR